MTDSGAPTEPEPPVPGSAVPESPEAGPPEAGPRAPEPAQPQPAEPGISEPSELPDRPYRPEQEAAGERKVPAGHNGLGLYPLARAGFIEYDRVVFFSDAVFAIAITLLAIDLRARVGKHGVVMLDSHGILGFWISFAVIGLFWLGHHGIFRYITALDRPLIGLNLLMLGIIAFLPYPTEVLSATGGDQVKSTVFYAVCVAAAGTAELAVWVYATGRKGLTDPSVATVRTLYTLRIARLPVVFLGSIPVAFASPSIAQYTWILVLLLGVWVNRYFHHRERRKLAG